MDDIKREEFEKACKREKGHKVWVRMVAVRMVRVSNMSVEETVSIQVRCPTWVRDWLRRYDEEGLRDLQMQLAQKDSVKRYVRHPS